MLTRRSRAAFWAVFTLSFALALPTGALDLDVEVGYNVFGATDTETDSADSGSAWAHVWYGGDQLLAAGDIGAAVVAPPASYGYASGFAREDGLMWSASYFNAGEGRLNGLPNGVGVLDNGLPLDVRFDSEVIWENTFTNTSGNDLPYAFNFVVDGPYLALWEPLGDSRLAGYEIDIQLDGDSRWYSRAEASSTNGSDPELTQWGTEIPYAHTPPGVWNFDDHEDTVSLGVIGAGQEFTLRYEMRTYVEGTGFPGGMVARIGDPFELETGDRPDPGPDAQGSGSVYVVPEPATITLLGLGLLGAATRRRWRSRG